MSQRINLRPYQAEAIASLMEAAERAEQNARDHKTWRADRVLAVQPTGSGKTILFLELARRVLEAWRWRSLIIVPSRELASQTAKRAEQFIPQARVGRVREESCHLSEIVISTAAGLHPQRLALIPPDAFELVVIDEAHHVAAASFEQILKHFSKARLMVGVTATYRRGDGISIAHEDYFPTCVVWNTIAQLTDMGYLVSARGHYIYTETSLEGISVCAGDFDERSLSRAVNTPERNQAAIDGWLRYAPARSSVAFCADIEHAKDLADCFNANGIAAKAVWGAMKKEEYEMVMADYREGKIQVLTNARLLIEGWDVPQTSCVLIARPATPAASCVLGPQMIGRALRPSPGKQDAVIIEVRDLGSESMSSLSELIASSRQAASLIAMAMDMPEEIVAGGQPLHEQSWVWRERKAWLERQRLLKSLCAGGVEEMFDVIERITQSSAYAWVPLGTTLYMDLGGGDFIEIVGTDCCEIRAVRQGVMASVGAAPNRSRAIELADSWLDRHSVNHYLHDRTQGWRTKAPTSAQIGVAHSLLKLPISELSRLTRGQVSDLITTARALQRPPNIERCASTKEAAPECGTAVDYQYERSRV